MRRVLAVAVAVAVVPVQQAAAAATPSRLPILDVLGRGFTPQQATSFSQSLGLSAVRGSDGSLRFVDPVNFGAVPVRPATAVMDEDDGQVRPGESLDVAALGSLQVPTGEDAIRRATAALSAAGMASPGSAAVEHGELVILDEAGEEQLVRQVDTQVEFRQTLNGVPLTGPGAKSDVTFGPSGAATRVNVRGLRLRPGATVPLLSPRTADAAARRLVAAGCGTGPAFRNISLKRKLVYYADATGGKIYPRYLYEPTVASGTGRLALEGFDLPAVRTGAPRARLRLSSTGAKIVARASISGGTAPYRVRYSSCSGSLDPRKAVDRRRVSFDLRAPGGNRRETVFVTVTDANGLSQTARTTITAQKVLAPPAPTAFAAIHGVNDYGVWSAAAQFPNSGSEDPDDFIDEMDDEVTRRVTHYNSSFKKTDWIEDSFPGKGGKDGLFGDNVDLAFIHTHGNPRVFNTGEAASGGGYKQVRYDDGLWGDGDLEWVALLACEILAGKEHANSGGLTRTARWGKSMPRQAHMLLSYESLSYSGVGSGNEFGDNLADDEMRVSSAWYDQAESEQPDGVVYAIMGPLGPNNEWNHSDHAFGLGGGVTADVPSIKRFWLRRGTV